MKAKIPKVYRDLSLHQQEKLKEYTREVAMEAANAQLNKDARIMLDLYIKMVCVVLHDAFGFGERRLTCFLGNHKRLFSRQARMVKDGTQIEYLNMRMAEIFRKDGFPSDFFENMIGKVEYGSSQAEIRGG